MSEDVTPPHSKDDSTLVVRGTAVRRVGELGLATFFAVFCLMSLFPPSGTALAPWLTVPLSALASLHFLGRSLDGRPRLIVDGTGITDRTSIGGGYLHIPWESVTGVSNSRWGGGSVELHVRNARELGRRAGIARRLWMRLGHLLGKRTVSVTPTLLGLRKGELKETLDEILLRLERTQLGLDQQPRSLPPYEEEGNGPGGAC